MAIVLNFGALSIATTYSFSGPATGLVGIDTADFSVTPNGPYIGTITVRISSNSYPTGIAPVVLSWNGTFETQRFSFIPILSEPFSLSATNSDTLINAPELTCLIGNPYYVSTAGSGGDGSLGNPWGPSDLLVAGIPVTQGVALTTLLAGDTLYFRAGDYHIAGDASHYGNQLICPTHSGTSFQPITLRAYPGEAVNIIVDSGIQPAMGTANPTLNYVRFLGFTVSPGPDAGFYISGTGCEVGFCEVIGQYVNTLDNHDAIRIDNATSAWIHHNNVHGDDGNPANHNSAQIKLYYDFTCIIEDNYCHDGQVGIFDKAVAASLLTGGALNVFRRNWIAKCYDTGFLGNNNNYAPALTHPALDYIYDNVIDNSFAGTPAGTPLNLYNYSIGNQVYNNLIFAGTSGGYGRSIGDGDNQYNPSLWNNITLFGGLSNPLAYSAYDQPVPPGPTSSLYFMDYNVYDVSPGYYFGINRALSWMQGNGFELNAAVDSTANIFVDEIAYVLRTAYQTAGRYGDQVGPRDGIDQLGRTVRVADIINASRYGPAAIGNYV